MSQQTGPTVEMIQLAQNVLRANPHASNRQIMDAVPGFREGWVVKYLIAPKAARPPRPLVRRKTRRGA